MHLCIFNPEHDLCLAKGRAHYVPPRSAVEFARRDASLMQALYPESVCMSVYDPRIPSLLSGGQAFRSAVTTVTAWGWDAVVKHEMLKRGCSEGLLPSDDELAVIRDLQHRSTVLPLQPDCHAVYNIEEMESLLRQREHWVMKAPWSGAGRGLHWVHGALTPIDRDWLLKTVATQRCVIAEPRRDVVADVALEYICTPQSVLRTASSPIIGEQPEDTTALPLSKGEYPARGEGVIFMGYSYFRTGSGVYKENIAWSDDRIETTFGLAPIRARVEQWLAANVWPRYHGPLGIDLMVCADGSIHVAEMNVRHTMGMVAHEKFRVMS